MNIGVSNLTLLSKRDKCEIYTGIYRDKKVAIKKMLWRDGCYLNRDTIVELAMYKYLDHPGILKYLSMQFDDNYFYLILPFHETLHETKEKIDVKTVLFHLLDTFSYLTRMRVLHRDVKSTNIVMNNGRPLLIDFGLAKVMCSNSVCGDAYPRIIRAPEIHAQSADYGEKAEVWALGTTLYSLLTGQYLQCTSDNTIDIMKEYIRCFQPSQGDLDKFSAKYSTISFEAQSIDTLGKYGDLGRICKRMLTFFDEDRPTFEEILQDPIFEGMRRHEVDIDNGSSTTPWEQYAINYLVMEYDTPYSVAKRIVAVFVNDYSEYTDLDITRKQVRNLFLKSKMNLIRPPIY